MTLSTSKAEIVDTLALLRLFTTHAAAITGSKAAGSFIVGQAVKKHPRRKAMSDTRKFDLVLKDITHFAQRFPVGPDNPGEFGKSFRSLSFEARACVSLRVNFEMDYDRIGRILGTTAAEARLLHEDAVNDLSEGITP